MRVGWGVCHDQSGDAEQRRACKNPWLGSYNLGLHLVAYVVSAARSASAPCSDALIMPSAWVD